MAIGRNFFLPSVINVAGGFRQSLSLSYFFGNPFHLVGHSFLVEINSAADASGDVLAVLEVLGWHHPRDQELNFLFAEIEFAGEAHSIRFLSSSSYRPLIDDLTLGDFAPPHDDQVRPVAVSEPSMAALLAVALAGLGLLRRGKRPG